MPRNHHIYNKLSKKEGELIEKMVPLLGDAGAGGPLWEAAPYLVLPRKRRLELASLANLARAGEIPDEVEQKTMFETAKVIEDGLDPEWVALHAPRRPPILKYALGGLLIGGLIVLILYVSGVIGHGKDKDENEDEKEDEIEGFGGAHSGSLQCGGY